MKSISIIVPCYNEEETVEIFYKETSKYLKEITDKYEIIYINDGSKDNTLSKVKKLADKDKKIKYISFSRNFGKEAAMYAGLEYAKGDYVAIMDVDLQDPPSLLREMYDTLNDGDYDCVASRRVTRIGEPKIRSFFARLYYKIINKISKTEIVDGARDFRMMTRQMVNSVLELKEYNRFSKGIFSFVGYNTKWLEYENKPRVAGETKWNFFKLFIYSIQSIVDFSTIPLVASAVIGLLFCILSFIMIIVIIIKTLVFTDPVGGWPSLVCIIFFVSGIQLLCIGIIGEYLANTYLEIKKRPIYIVKETNSQKNKD